MMALPPEGHQKAIIGNVESSFWLYDSLKGFDLTHPPSPNSPTVENAVRIQTMTVPITIDPAKSALVIIDMQNFFLSTALGRSAVSKGLEAQAQLLRYAIPAARRSGIRILWLNWGLTDDDVRQMPPATLRLFGFETTDASYLDSHPEETTRAMPEMQSAKTSSTHIVSKNPRLYCGLGNELGPVTLTDGSIVEAGRLLMRHQWNTALNSELAVSYQQGRESHLPDVWIHKNRLSGFWGASTPCTEFLQQEGIKTLFFAGVNTDQCVGGSLSDAYMKGYDCILLRDGSATSSPAGAQECWELNANAYGFVLSCEDLWNGVEAQHKQ